MVARGRGAERRRRGGRPSSSKAGTRGDIRASFLAPKDDSHLYGTRQNHGFIQTPFSLSEEARNTERHHSWNTDLKLRHSRIAFISAGTSTADDLNPVVQESKTNNEATNSSLVARNVAPVKAPDNLSTAHTMIPNTQMSNMTLNDLQCVTSPQVHLEVGLNSVSERSNEDSDLECTEASNEDPFRHHEYGHETPIAGVMTPIIRCSPTPTDSDSSGEVIIFAGRLQSSNEGDRKRISNTRSKNSNFSIVPKHSGHRSSLAPLKDSPRNAIAQEVQNSSKHSSSISSSLDHEHSPSYFSRQPRLTTIKSRRGRRRRHLEKGIKDEGILDDYVANLDEGGAMDTSVEGLVLNQRDLGSSDTADWQGEVELRAREYVERASITDYEEWDSAEESFNELSQWNEGLKGIDLVLSKRERPSGVQYLVVGPGCSVDDARWFPISSLNVQGAEASIQKFENNAQLDHRLNGSDASNASVTRDEQVARDLQEGFNDEEDRKDLEERRKPRMTDEQVAILLAKQDELGLGSDTLMLYDGGDIRTDSRDELQIDGLWGEAMTHGVASRSERTKRSRLNVLSATAFEDVLDDDLENGFDVMDRKRPSLRERPKGRRGKLSLGLSDSELEHSIRTAWEKDRTKKRMRKQEREELRAQGLLGKKSEAGLKAKCSEGISMTQVKKEIREFLLSSMESLSLPPMNHGERKIVHEIANVFKLKSKSTGGGRSRYPVLYRTPRTIRYSQETFKAAESVLFSGRFLPHIARVRRKGAIADRGGRGGGGSTGVSYRDGEVVGAAAPEIGQENRGRTMLERMGWSTGTALGALNNSRGLVQPVAQVVKTSRSGLG